jgi:hypothetical protein
MPFTLCSHPFIEPQPRVLNLDPPELHSSDLLRDYPDSEKLRVLSEAATLTNSHGLRVLRVGIVDNADLRQVFKTEDNIYGYCGVRFLSKLEATLAKTMVLPVVDSMAQGRIRHFSGASKSFEAMRAIGMDLSISIQNTDNLIGEVFHADSKYASMIQFADLVSYLLTGCEVDEIAACPSNFKACIVAIARSLRADLVDCHIFFFSLKP